MSETAIAALIAAAIEVWRIHANKPPGWEPSAEDFARLRKQNAKTAEDYEREAVAEKSKPNPQDSFYDNAR